MNRSLFSAAAAAALSLAMLAGSPGFAQVQLAQEVADQLHALGIEPEGLVLTEDQVLQIENVLNTAGDDDTKKEQINLIVAE